MVQVQELFDNNILLILMSVLCSLGILVKILIYGIYKNLIKSSDNMANTNNKLMKLVKMKFEACYKLKIGVNNVDIFVDKYMYKYKFCGILLYTWENISGQLLILCLLTGAIGAGLAVYYDCGKTAILSTFFIGLLTSALLIIFESFLNLPAKRNIIRINMKDYLENMLKVRLEQENFYPEKLEEYRNEYFINENEERNTDNTDKHNVSQHLEKKSEQKVKGKDLLHIEDTAAVKEEVQNGVNYIKGNRDRKREDGQAKFSSKNDRKLNPDKKTTENYKINKEEEEIIEDILKEFMA
ncbi:hypothetical protein EDD66_11353 [Mobilisporobacter senegalensis]|uniref:Uncharacterized protein n=1 Tax=Mobilisporobacter senegalensis TaxID=1329262 RepID=A0A3N1XCA6_9FIRM|nr:hypothetical protein [Mobilisporobacter senegalensis]ROR23658.1 hypothetical protein EDD66_11353 [Mobilisporobacter senegalensis]